MSKKPLVKKSTAKGGKKNELHVPTKMNPPRWEVKVWGEGGNLVKYFHDLSPKSKSNRAVITFSFDSGKDKYKVEDLEEVTYRVVNPEPSSEEEWKKMESEALADFIINKSSDLLSENEYKDINDLRYFLKKNGDKINLLVKKKDGIGQETIEDLQLEGEFWPKEPIKWKDFVTIAPPPKTAWWKTTWGKITIGIVVGAILLLIIIFRKKIRSWVKGGKKKSPETIIL
ncbi:MAG: hypothetical protein I3270_01815 [Candidatus Moeniiplasma glomeromycotorum]|nr:hypothetical protein [Candidatus Moeniiplasma glomeromycotorum]MCE8162439.1 hypothetical protein [Candidatus Moeniiplasma glomeromycotorum]MCE8166365.1 hypothetical protein [Candidatus Moeniiplasma glomeromycotorum]MCE8166847.1 hypothetical protein [Candidatus Moeniiplasma glomeromycotorum]